MNTAIQQAVPVAHLDADTRAAFILRTYAHLIGAIIAFVGIEVFLFSQGMPRPLPSGCSASTGC